MPETNAPTKMRHGGVEGAPVTFASGDLTLEGFLDLARESGHPGLVLCAPHPLYNGSMEDSRLTAIASAAISKGFNTLRFNYRGVGSSQGTYGQGVGEIQDVVAAMRFLRQHPHIDGSRIALVGYSFGGSVALAAALNADPAALVTLSASLRPPNAEPSLVADTLRYIRCPAYIVHGQDDEVIPPVEAEGIYAQLQVRDKYLRLIKGANHYYARHLDDVVRAVLAFLTDKLGSRSK
jgi:alpha/beta superfamily hydrolase